MSFNYSNSGWRYIDNVILERLAICRRKLGQMTGFVLCCLQLIENRSLLSPQELERYIDQLNEATIKMENREFFPFYFFFFKETLLLIFTFSLFSLLDF